LTYSATLAGGAALPTWLTFDAASRTFSGTPPTSGPINVEVRASDGLLFTPDVFTINVAPPPSPPPPPPPAGNLLVNGSFEQPAVALGQSGDFTAIPGWTAIAGGGIEIWNHRIGTAPTDGANHVELDNAGAQDGFYQDIVTSAGQTYTLKLDAMLRPEKP